MGLSSQGLRGMGPVLGGQAWSRDVFLYYPASQKTSTVMLIETQKKSLQAKRGISVTKCHQTFSFHNKKHKLLTNFCW